MYGPYRWFMAIFHISIVAPTWTIGLKRHLGTWGNYTITLKSIGQCDIERSEKNDQKYSLTVTSLLLAAHATDFISCR